MTNSLAGLMSNLSSGKSTIQIVLTKADDPTAWYQSVAGVLSAALWPAVAFGLCYLFREEIGRLIDRIKEVSIAGQTVKTALAEAEERVSELPPAPKIVEGVGNATGSASTSGVSEKVVEKAVETLPARLLREIDESDLADSSPTTTVIETWSIIGQALRGLALKYDQTDLSKKMPWQIAKHLRGQDIINEQLLGSLSYLRKVRNEAAHGARVEPEDANRYTRLAGKVLATVMALYV